MKKKILSIILIIAIIGICIVSIIIPYVTSDPYTIDVNEDDVNNYPADVTRDSYTVKHRVIEESIYFQAQVNNEGKNAVRTISVPSNFVVVHVKVGDLIETGELIYTQDGVEFLAEQSMYCLEIVNEDIITFTCLYFDELCIEAKIPYEYCFDSRLFSSIIELSYDNDMVQGEIVSLDYTNNGGYVNAKIRSDAIKWLPGTTLNVKVVLEHKESAVAIPLACILAKTTGNGEYCVKVLKDGIIYNQIIEIGIIDGDYAEIISGISLNDVVIIPAEEESIAGR